MLKLPDPGRRLATAVALSAVGVAGFGLALPALGRFWVALVSRVHDFLAMPGPVIAYPTTIGPIELVVPTVALDAPIPVASTLSVAGGVTAALILVSLAMRGRWLPLAYFLRAVAVVLTTSIGFFAFWPDQFPYRLSEYLVGQLRAGLVVMGLVPLLLGFTFYLFDLSAIRKLLLTLMVMGHLAVFLPLQGLVHALLIVKFSLVAMPVLLLLFGILLDVMIFVAFYGWAMSWPSALWEEPRRG